LLVAVYSATPTGWFEMRTFTEWFKLVLLLHVSKLHGGKVLVCDNLGCYFSEEVNV